MNIKPKASITLALLTLLAINLTSCMKKYEYIFSESAPKNYPMIIVGADLYLDEQGQDIANSVRPGRLIANGWGSGASLDSEVIAPVPKHMRVYWFSFWEDCFYRADGPIPYQKLEAFMQLYPEATHILTVGAAPGGKTTLFASTLGEGNRRINLGSLQGERTDKISWERYLRIIGASSDVVREEYRMALLESKIDSITKARVDSLGIPFGLWDEFEKKYATSIEFLPQGKTLKLAAFSSVNGEYINYDNFKADFTPGEMIAPIYYVTIIWTGLDGVDYWAKAVINKEEVLKAYQSIGEQAATFSIKVNKESREKGALQLFVKGNGKTIELKDFSFRFSLRSK